MKKNDRIKLDIFSINNLGFGVARHEGKVVFVSGACDNETVLAHIIKVNSDYAIGKSVDILSPSPDRCEPACPVSSSCGGCAFGNITFQHENELKKEIVSGEFKKQGIDAIINNTVTNGKCERYRNKSQYPFDIVDEKAVCGFYAPKTHRLIDCEDCILQPEHFSICVDKIKKLAEANLDIFFKNGRSLIRHIYIRSAQNKDTLLCPVLYERNRNAEELLMSMAKEIPFVRSLYININKDDTNVVLGEEFHLLFGEEKLTDTLCGKEFLISPASFYQVNHSMTELLYNKAAELADIKDGDQVLDLFCGIGSIGLSSVSGSCRLVGVEIVPDAVDNAKENARRNGIINAEFYVSDAKETEKYFRGSPDVVFLDPPRKGVSFELLEYLTDTLKAKRIVYISCNPATLARDAKLLIDNGYAMSSVTPYNLFPRTGHTECVTSFTK